MTGGPSGIIHGRVILVAFSPWRMNWLLEQQQWHNWNPSCVIFPSDDLELVQFIFKEYNPTTA